MRTITLIVASLGAVLAYGAAFAGDRCTVQVERRIELGHAIYEISGTGFPRDREIRIEAVHLPSRRGQVMYVTPDGAAFSGVFLGKESDGRYTFVMPGRWKVTATAGKRRAKARFTAPQTAPMGAWGGDQIGFRVHEKGAVLDLACAGGRVEQPIFVDEAGHFDVPGIFTDRRIGPSAGEDHPARYVGDVDSTTMTLTIVRTDTEETVGAWALTLKADEDTFRDPCV